MLRNEIWAPIRSNEALLDLVMKASTNFEMRMLLRDDCDFVKLKDHLSKTMGGRSGVASTIVDQDFAGKVIDANALREYMQVDSWLAFVFFAMLNVSILVRYEVTDAAESGSKDTN